MYSQTLYNSFVNIVPFWSSNLIQYLGLGNEYNIALNFILTELLKIITQTLNDKILIGITIGIICIFIGYKYGIGININLFEKNIIKLLGKESYGSNDLSSTTIDYCEKILSINDYLLKEKKIKNITFINGVDVIINDVSNYKLFSNINLTIRRQNNQNLTTVTYELSSYSMDIENFLNKLVSEYKKLSKSEITLIGDENNKIITYPEQIYAINYYINKNFTFSKLKCMKVNTNPVNTNPVNTDNSSNDIQLKQSNTQSNKQIVERKKSIPMTHNYYINNEKNIQDYIFTLDNINNFDMGGIFLTINRNNEKSQVIYKIKSDKINCKEWLNTLSEDYINKTKKKFKNSLFICGVEQILKNDSNSNNDFNKLYQFPEILWILNWYLIDILNCQNIQCSNGYRNNQYFEDVKYILTSLEYYQIKDDLFLSLDKIPDTTGNIDVICTLYSNQTNIKDFLEEITIKYTKMYKQKKSEILYHFTYNGKIDGRIKFKNSILSEKNTSLELFETFDKIHNEHVEFLKKDIDKLKDIEYYKKYGLKRKKGYLFHGIPGCGKTSSVVAMALYDSRHIIEIPFSLLNSHQEFEEIMSLNWMYKGGIDNNNVIILFDEIDIGINKIENRNDVDDNNNNTELISSLVNSLKQKEKLNTETKINLGTLLSKLDGISNYNGMIIVATTNCIDKLDPALYRELRLTPVKFDKLRKIDCVNIIHSYFGSNYDPELNNIIADRKITPTKLIHLCQQYENLSIEDFFNNVLKKLME